MKQTNLELILGDTWERTITFNDASGTPINITGATITMSVKREPSDASALIQKQVTSHSNPTLGQSAIAIAPADWVGVASGTYVYDMQIVLASAKKYTVMRGQMVVVDDISKV